MRRPLRRLLATAASTAALAAGYLLTGPPAQLPVAPAPAFALEALVTSAAAGPRRGHPQGRPAAASATATATVAGGGSLSQLAARYYHHASWWPRIWWANRALIHNPDLVPAGAHLLIPAPRHPRWTTTRAALAAIPPPPPPPAPAPAPAADPAPAPASAPPPAATGTVTAASGYEACVISAESGGNPSAVNPSSGAGGLYQFLPSTWAGLGYSGLPQDASPATQQQAFDTLYAQSGSAPWSSDGCG